MLSSCATSALLLGHTACSPKPVWGSASMLGINKPRFTSLSCTLNIIKLCTCLPILSIIPALALDQPGFSLHVCGSSSRTRGAPVAPVAAVPATCMLHDCICVASACSMLHMYRPACISVHQRIPWCSCLTAGRSCALLTVHPLSFYHGPAPMIEGVRPPINLLAGAAAHSTVDAPIKHDTHM